MESNEELINQVYEAARATMEHFARTRAAQVEVAAQVAASRERIRETQELLIATDTALQLHDYRISRIVPCRLPRRR